MGHTCTGERAQGGRREGAGRAGKGGGAIGGAIGGGGPVQEHLLHHGHLASVHPTHPWPSHPAAESGGTQLQLHHGLSRAAPITLQPDPSGDYEGEGDGEGG